MLHLVKTSRKLESMMCSLDLKFPSKAMGRSGRGGRRRKKWALKEGWRDPGFLSSTSNNRILLQVCTPEINR